jgi:hypothetical protein
MHNTNNVLTPEGDCRWQIHMPLLRPIQDAQQRIAAQRYQ